MMWWTEMIAVIAIVSILLCGGTLIKRDIENEERETATKQKLYTECLTTDYDKFQCYSMIYGDK